MKIIIITFFVLLPVFAQAGEWLPRACGTGSPQRTPQNELDEAIKSHDISNVQAALRIPGIKINYDGITDCAPPIFVAINEGQSDIFNLLVHSGADINSVVLLYDGESLYRTPLMWAAIIGQTQLVKEILKYPEVRVNYVAQNLYGQTALFLAVANKHYDAALLIANHPEVNVNITVPRYLYRTPLLILMSDACGAPVCPSPAIDVNLVSVLAQKSGTFINSDKPNTRPIRDAVWSKNKAAVDGLLTSKDIDLFTAGKSGSSGLDEAIWVDNDYAVKKIIDRPELPAGLIERYVTNYPKVSGLRVGETSLAFSALFESPSLNPNAMDTNGKSLLERYAALPEYVFPLLKNPMVDVNINNGGPLRAAKRSYFYARCEKKISDKRCEIINFYIKELENLGAH